MIRVQGKREREMWRWVWPESWLPRGPARRVRRQSSCCLWRTSKRPALLALGHGVHVATERARSLAHRCMLLEPRYKISKIAFMWSATCHAGRQSLWCLWRACAYFVISGRFIYIDITDCARYRFIMGGHQRRRYLCFQIGARARCTVCRTDF